MNARHLARYVSLVVLLAGCGGATMLVDYDSEARWSNYRSWDFLAEPLASTIGPLAENPANRTSIESSIEREAKRRGLRRVADAPDLLVAYYAGKTDKVDPATWGYTYGPKDRYSQSNLDVARYKGGTIIIDFVDAKTKQLVWRGASPGVVNAPNNDKVENSIRETVGKILDKYPPR